MDPDPTKVANPIKKLLMTAFSSGGFLSGASSPNNTMHFLPATSVTIDGQGTVIAQYFKIQTLTYGDTSSKSLYPTLRQEVLESLDKWCQLREKVGGIQKRMATADFTGDSADGPDSLLKFYVDISATDVLGQISGMQSACNSFSTRVEEVGLTAESLKAGWVLYAKECTKSTSTACFDHLNSWSDFLNEYDNSLPLLRLAAKRFMDLRTNMEGKLADLLSELAMLCLDMYGNMLAGARAEVDAGNAALKAWAGRLDDWLRTCPSWTSEEYSSANRVKRGEVSVDRDNKRRNWFDDPFSVNVATEFDVQVGVTYMDFGLSHGCIGYEVNVINQHNANRVWERSDYYADKVIFFGTKLSWIEIPPPLRETVLFNYTVVDNTSEEMRHQDKEWLVSGAGVDTQKVGTGSGMDGEFNILSASWEVKFPKAFATDSVKVQAWLMDLKVYGRNDYYTGVTVWANEVNRDKFRMNASIPYNWSVYPARLAYARIAYVAFADPPTAGFFATSYELNIKGIDMWNQQGHHDYNPVFIPFPTGKFQRLPSVVNLMSAFCVNTKWNCRVDYNWAASRDGILIHPGSWDDTVLGKLRFEILAIENKVW